MYRKNSGKFDVQVSNKKCIHAHMRKHCRIKVGGDSMQAGEVVANHNSHSERKTMPSIINEIITVFSHADGKVHSIITGK